MISELTPEPEANDWQAGRTAQLGRGWRALKRDWPIWLVSGATLANGVLSILSVMAARYSERPELFTLPLPFGVYHWSRSLGVAFGLC